MNTSEILEAIDQEIVKLEQVRALLADTPAVQAAKPAAAKFATGKRRGRPKGSVNKKTEVAAPVVVKSAKRTMSAEGKAKIAAAQKARWAKQKKAIAKPVAENIAAKTAKKAVPVAAKVSKKMVPSAERSAPEPATEA